MNWISARLGWDIYGVNLICGGLFSAGLVRYCRSKPYPWLALSLAFPYLGIVVAMGYSRQGVAIGLELFALLALERDRLLHFVVWIGLAATFHASALTMLVLPLATIKRSLAGGQAYCDCCWWRSRVMVSLMPTLRAGSSLIYLTT